jgi:hypothetical protein
MEPLGPRTMQENNDAATLMMPSDPDVSNNRLGALEDTMHATINQYMAQHCQRE